MLVKCTPCGGLRPKNFENITSCLGTYLRDLFSIYFGSGALPNLTNMIAYRISESFSVVLRPHSVLHASPHQPGVFVRVNTQEHILVSDQYRIHNTAILIDFKRH